MPVKLSCYVHYTFKGPPSRLLYRKVPYPIFRYMETIPLRDAMLNAPTLARLSGLSVYTIRAILEGKRRRLYPSTRRKLAAALRAHSATLMALADQLEQ